MFRNICLFGYLFGYILIHPFILSKGLKALKNGDMETVDAIAMKHVPIWANKIVKLTGVNFTVTGFENIPKDRSCVFAANHRSAYDIIVMLTQLGSPHPIVAKAETLKIPLISSWMKMLHCLFLERDNPRQAMQVINDAAELVKKGYNVSIFPEGTRYKGEEGGMGEFLSGAFRIASKANAPIVPVAIFNSRATFEGHKGIGLGPADVAVHILPPVETAGIDRTALKALPKQVEDMVRHELEAGA